MPSLKARIDPEQVLQTQESQAPVDKSLTRGARNKRVLNSSWHTSPLKAYGGCQILGVLCIYIYIYIYTCNGYIYIHLRCMYIHTQYKSMNTICIYICIYIYIAIAAMLLLSFWVHQEIPVAFLKSSKTSPKLDSEHEQFTPRTSNISFVDGPPVFLGSRRGQ